MPEKKDWVQPRLEVLGRGEGAESILHNCKTATVSGGYKSLNVGCYLNQSGCALCQESGHS